jgi:anti-anti-sigma factor
MCSRSTPDGLVERRGRSIDEGIDALADALTAAGASPDADAILSVLGADHGLDDDVALLVAHATPVDLQRLDLTLDAAPTTLAPLRRALTRWLDANAVGAQTAYDILLAVNEWATNAIEHAYGPARRASPWRRGVTATRSRSSYDLDLSNLQAVHTAVLDSRPNEAAGLVVDLSRVTFLDSSGVDMLYRLQRSLGVRQQRFAVAAPEAPIRRAL